MIRSSLFYILPYCYLTCVKFAKCFRGNLSKPSWGEVIRRHLLELSCQVLGLSQDGAALPAGRHTGNQGVTLVINERFQPCSTHIPTKLNYPLSIRNVTS